MTPRARRPRIGGTHDGALRVAVAAPPVAGRANAACVDALAAALGIPRARIELDPAARGRRKRVRIRDGRGPEVAALRALAAEPGLG